LFESLGAIAPELFSDDDKYKRFAQKVWPVLAQSREQLLECYQADNGRPGVEPVMLLGVMIFQFLERVPDRQAVELVKYPLGWKLALNLKLSEGGFHPTTLVYFRQRLPKRAGPPTSASDDFPEESCITSESVPPSRIMRLGKDAGHCIFPLRNGSCSTIVSDSDRQPFRQKIVENNYFIM
jgi:hypothetical protein